MSRFLEWSPGHRDEKEAVRVMIISCQNDLALARALPPPEWLHYAPAQAQKDEGETTLSLERVTVVRGSQEVLRDVSFRCQRGTVTAIVGPSGVGKTSLLGTINGLVQPVGGRVSIPDVGALHQPQALRVARRQTGMIFQDHALIGRLTALDNVLLGLADTRHPLSPLPWSRADQGRAAQALHDVGLLDKAMTRTSVLSGGERQRVGIARALVRRPRLLLGDEPFASLDPVLALRLGQDFRHLVHRDGLTVVLVLHQLSLARTLADRVIGLSAGRVVFDGSPAAFDAAAEALIFHGSSSPSTSAAPAADGPYALC